MSRYQIKFHLHTAKGKLITIPDLDIRRNELIHKIRAVLHKGLLRMLPVHSRVRSSHINFRAKHLTHKFCAADVVHMAMGKNQPLYIRRIKTGFPDGVDQHGSIFAVPGIDQQKSVSGIDQVYTYPAVTHIIHISEHAKWLHITRILLCPVF